jgi:hypothetical protein
MDAKLGWYRVAYAPELGKFLAWGAIEGGYLKDIRAFCQLSPDGFWHTSFSTGQSDISLRAHSLNEVQRLTECLWPHGCVLRYAGRSAIRAEVDYDAEASSVEEWAAGVDALLAT